MILSGWGRHPKISCSVFRPKNINELNELVGIEKCENKVYNFAWNFCSKTQKLSDDDKKKK